MKQRVIAIFDIGKTNKKLLLFDNHFNVVHCQERRLPTTLDEDGFECDDIEAICNWIDQSIFGIVQQNQYQIEAINFSTYGASLMFVDEDGSRLTPLFNYLKPIPDSVADRLFFDYGGKAEFCRTTASPALELLLNSGIQILWLQQFHPDVYKKVNKILHFPQYLSFRLTGKVVAEHTSIGCHTFLWDFDKMKYHDWIRNISHLLPELIENSQTSSVEMLGQSIKVGTGIHDSSASLIPYLRKCSDPFLLISTGTWGIFMNPINQEPLSQRQLQNDCLCFLTPDQKKVTSSRLFMGYFHDAWLDRIVKIFKVDKQLVIATGWDEALYDKLCKGPLSVPMFFPDGRDSFARGLNKLDLDVLGTFQIAYTKLLMELVGLCVESIRLILTSNDDVNTMFVTGGFARNELFVQMLKHNFPIAEITVWELDNASALGAAMVVGEDFFDIDHLKAQDDKTIAAQ